jgi:hypothetical protein
LVGRGVTTQAPSNNNNSNNTSSNTNNNTSNNNTSKRNSRTQSSKKSVAFNIKQQKVVFLELRCKERKKNGVYVDGGCVMAVVNI